MADIYGQLIKAQLENLTSDPSSPPEGLVYFKTDTNLVRFYDGSAWHSVMDLDSSQTATNKTFTSPQINTGTLLTPVIDDYADLNEESAPSTPSAGKVRLYAKSDKKLWTKDSAGTESQVGAGGTGEISLLESGSSDITDWSTTGANGPTGATTTTAGDLPLSPVVDTAIKLTSSSSAGAEASHYFGRTLTVPEALKSRKHKVEFWIRPGTNFIASEWTVSVYSGATRMALSTDSSSVTYLPNATGKFTTTFDADTSGTYTLRFSRPVNAGGNAAVLNVAGIVVGPGTQPQGAVVGPWQSYTPTFSNSTNITVTKAQWRQEGDSVRLKIRLDWTGAGAGGTFTVALPNSYTINTTVISSSTTNAASKLGEGFVRTTAPAKKSVVAQYESSTDLSFSSTYNVSEGWAGTDFAANGYQLQFEALVPVNELAGSGTVNVAQNDVEYAWNSSTTDAADTTSFGYGPVGTGFPSVTTSAKLKRIRFQTPIQVGDKLSIEVSKGGSAWMDIEEVAYENGLVPLKYQNTNTYGLGLDIQSINSTDIDVVFGIYAAASGATYAAAGAAWSGLSTYKWRVRKESPGAAVGFGEATTTSLGLTKLPASQVIAATANGHGSTNTSIRRFSSFTTVGSAITAADSATLGTTFTIGEAGIYAMSYTDMKSGGTGNVGFSLNSSDLTTAIHVITAADRLCAGSSGTGGDAANASVTVRLAAGDIIRPHDDGNMDATTHAKVVIVQLVRL